MSKAASVFSEAAFLCYSLDGYRYASGDFLPPLFLLSRYLFLP